MNKVNWDNAAAKMLKTLGMEQTEQSGLQYRLNEIEAHRKITMDSANLLYISEFLKSDEYLSICDRINTFYNSERQKARDRYCELKNYVANEKT